MRKTLEPQTAIDMYRELADSIDGDISELQTIAISSETREDELLRLIKLLKTLRQKVENIRKKLGKLEDSFRADKISSEEISMELENIMKLLVDIRGNVQGLRKNILALRS